MNNNYLDKVKEFHETFGAPVLETPQIPSKERCNLRIKLMQEELNEIKEAIENNDLVEISDGLADLAFVLFGSILEFGVANKFDELFNEVQRSNMSKACTSIQDAIETLSHYKQKDGTEGYYKEVDGKWLVYRTSDNKVLKSINYSPANLKDILNEVEVNNNI
jgi:predicted HAD superfamily Cof-like phosphohydrolase